MFSFVGTISQTIELKVDPKIPMTGFRQLAWLWFFDDNPQSEINDSLNSFEVTDVPCNDGSSDLVGQQRDTNVVVLSWIA